MVSRMEWIFVSVLVGSLSSNMSWDQWGRTWYEISETEATQFGEAVALVVGLTQDSASKNWSEECEEAVAAKSFRR